MKAIPASDEVAGALLDKNTGKHGYVVANGLKFHYVENKGNDGTAEKSALVLFLHGFPEHWYSWRNQVKAIGSALGRKYHAVAIDCRGYGWTERPKKIDDYKIETLIEDVRCIIEKLGYLDKDVLLVGHDWGE